MSNAKTSESLKLRIARGNATRNSFNSLQNARSFADRCGGKYWAIGFGARFAVVTAREASILVTVGVGAWL